MADTCVRYNCTAFRGYGDFRLSSVLYCVFHNLQFQIIKRYSSSYRYTNFNLISSVSWHLWPQIIEIISKRLNSFESDWQYLCGPGDTFYFRRMSWENKRIECQLSFMANQVKVYGEMTKYCQVISCSSFVLNEEKIDSHIEISNS